MNSLVNNLIKDGYLRTDSVIEALLKINRMDFVPQELEKEAFRDIALPIGFGQTISQPKTVTIMLELLDAKEGHNILDIGSGSGWTTALLSRIVGETGKVTALEKIEKLMEKGRSNVKKYSYVKKGIAQFHLADGSQGHEKNSPYDRILVSASTYSVPNALKEQLKVGGKMVIPIVNSIVYIEKRGEDDFYEEKYPGFAFVPLIRN